jgi:tetratricopeptide (TPR) repeat protein
MKRIVQFSVLIVLCWFQPAWADITVADQVTILPLSRDHVLVAVESPKPIIMEITRVQGFPALLLKNACIRDTLVAPNKQLNRQSFIRPVPYPVRTQQTPEGISLIFESQSPVTLSITSSETGFIQEAARELPLYPQWNTPPISSHESAGTLMNRASKAFMANRTEEATQALETLFDAELDPSQALYQLLGALYLHQGDWVKALALYGQGSHQFPEALGLRYAALLYQLHQLDKASQVLSDLLITVDIPPDTVAQAHYMLGSIYAEQRAYDKALPHLKLAAEAFSNHPDVLFNLAVGYEGVKQPVLALATYQKALPLSKDGLYQEVQAQIHRLQSRSSVLSHTNPS